MDNIQGIGRYVGTYIGLSTLQRYWWGEGEIKFYIDGDREFPTICGTGMEDYFGGSWSFSQKGDPKMMEHCYSMHYLGYPFYRWHAKDPIFFDENLRVTIQQIGVCSAGLFERQDDLSSVAFWYQREPHNTFPELPDKRKRWPR